MNLTICTGNEKLALMNFYTADKEILIETPGDFLGLIAMKTEDTLILNRDQFVPDFFDLKTGLAGEILQKCSNYRKRLVILGDFSAENSTSLRQFIAESNRGGQVVFAADLEEAEKRLK